MNRIKGYSGYVDVSQRIPPTLKQGESDERSKAKYQFAGKGQQKYFPNSTQTIHSTQYNNDYSNLKSEHYSVKDKRGVSANWNNKLKTTKFFGRSSSSDELRDSRGEALRFVEKCSSNNSNNSNNYLKYEDFKKAFEFVCGGRGYIYRSQIIDVMQKMYGLHRSTKQPIEIAPKWIAAKFEANFAKISSGQITWELFEPSIPKICECVLSDSTSIGIGTPEWMINSRKWKPRVIQSKYTSKSAYGHDVSSWPNEREFMYKNGMKSCNLDLMEGTSKLTYHVPGYCGHIPINLRHPNIMKQADMAKPRNGHTDLLLNYSHDISGYTGHKPSYGEMLSGPRTSGCDPRTSNGAIYSEFGGLL